MARYVRQQQQKQYEQKGPMEDRQGYSRGNGFRRMLSTGRRRMLSSIQRTPLATVQSGRPNSGRRPAAEIQRCNNSSSSSTQFIRSHLLWPFSSSSSFSSSFSSCVALFDRFSISKNCRIASLSPKRCDRRRSGSFLQTSKPPAISFGRVIRLFRMLQVCPMLRLRTTVIHSSNGCSLSLSLPKRGRRRISRSQDVHALQVVRLKAEMRKFTLSCRYDVPASALTRCRRGRGGGGGEVQRV